MMTGRFLIVLLAAVFATVNGLRAEPEDKSIKAWQAVQKKVDQEVEVRLAKMFKERFENLEKIKGTLYKKGQIVKVRLTPGRPRLIEGMFHGVVQLPNGEYKVKIGNGQYLLTDIDPVNARRLLFAVKPDELPKYIAGRIEVIEREKALLRKQWQIKGYAQNKYDSIFLERSIVIGDRFYTAADLGVANLSCKLDVPRSHGGNAMLRIAVNCPLVDGFVIVHLGDDGVLATTEDYTNPKSKVLKKIILTGQIARKDLGAEPAAMIANRLTIQFASLKLGKSWVARASISGPAERGSTHGVNVLRHNFKFHLVSNQIKDFTKDDMVEVKIGILTARSYQRRMQAAAAKAKEPAKVPAKKPAPAAK